MLENIVRRVFTAGTSIGCAALVGCASYASPQKLFYTDDLPRQKVATVFNWGQNGAFITHVGNAKIDNHLASGSWNGYTHWFVKPGQYNVTMNWNVNDSKSTWTYTGLRDGPISNSYALVAGHVYVPVAIEVEAEKKVYLKLIDKGTNYPLSCATSFASISAIGSYDRFKTFPECP